MHRADTGPDDTGPVPHTPDTRTRTPCADTGPRNTCRNHTHGDVCGDCGYGMGTFDSPEFAGYCD